MDDEAVRIVADGIMVVGIMAEGTMQTGAEEAGTEAELRPRGRPVTAVVTVGGCWRELKGWGRAPEKEEAREERTRWGFTMD